MLSEVPWSARAGPLCCPALSTLSLLTPLMSHSEVMIVLHSHTAMQVTGPRSLPLGVDVTTDGSRFRHAHQAMYPPASDRRLGSEARNKLLLSSNLPSHG